jgi:GPH family glycoside/pentoside/hexuronide:cation symporter
MATDYDERTSLNTFRAAAAVLGTFFAVAMKPLSDALGGDADAWWWSGVIIAVWLVLPWLAVHAVSFERPGFQRSSRIGFVEGAKVLARHRAYRILSGLYILARIAVDLIGAMFLYYFAVWLGREQDFAPTLLLFLGLVVLCLPFWLRIARLTDKRNIFVFGAAWWIGAELLIFLGQPEWPRWTIYAIACLAAVGYAVADLMPWAMLGDVIDEDELATGERREGMYVGFFTFIRKLGGATAVLCVGLALDFAGYSGDLPRDEQPETALFTIRVLMALVPSLLLALAIWVAVSYPLSRAAHRRVLAEIRRRGTSI